MRKTAILILALIGFLTLPVLAAGATDDTIPYDTVPVEDTVPATVPETTVPTPSSSVSPVKPSIPQGAPVTITPAVGQPPVPTSAPIVVPTAPALPQTGASLGTVVVALLLIGMGWVIISAARRRKA